ncbi:PKD domain-containing protein, partial [Candidatus Azambacteria bacterium]|nr:PKD domain-containing protein [Candidatus Azambacteria bacterium]
MGNTSGWAALFSSQTHSKDTIVDYVEYGAGGQTWESAAVGAGIWTAGAFLPDGDAGTSLGRTSDGKDTNAPGDWSVLAAPTLGASNPSTQPGGGQASSGGTQSGIGQVGVNQPPKADAGPNRLSFVNEPLAFSAFNSTDPEGAALSLFWNFGDGFTDTRPTTTHAYKRPGRYVVTLAVSDGASTSTAQII